MTLYTALGLLGTERNIKGRHPVITSGGEKKLLDIPEMIIWSTLKGSYTQMPRLESLYEQRVAAFGLEDVPPCSAYIDRMLQRGLIADGHGERGHDALYDLLADLQIVPVETTFFSRLASTMNLAVRGILPWRMVRSSLRRPRLTTCEREVITLCEKVHLSTAEVIACIEKGHKKLLGIEDVLFALYSDTCTNYDNIAGEARAFVNEKPCLIAIANLYLRSQILFERV